MKTICLVAGREAERLPVRRILEEHYSVFAAFAVPQMFDLLDTMKVDMILLDTSTQELDLVSTLQRLKLRPLYARTPVIVLTDTRDAQTEAGCFLAGAVDYIAKPVLSDTLLGRIRVHLKASEQELMRAKRFQDMQSDILSILADIIDHRDHTTGGHVLRTSMYIKILLENMRKQGIYEKEMRKWKNDTIIPSSSLHDVGKIVISDTILNKPDKLSAAEFELIKTHTTRGMNIIERMESHAGGGAYLSHAKLFAGSHHEHWDGTGYPRGTKGAHTPLEGRVLAIADVYDALISERPYKRAYTYDEAERIILDGAGTHFDPLIAEVFESVRTQFRTVDADIS